MADVIWTNDRRKGVASKVAIDAYCECVEGLLTDVYQDRFPSENAVSIEEVDLIERAVQFHERAGKRGAVALLDGQVLIDQFTTERLRDPVLNELTTRVDVVVDPEMDAIYPAKYAGTATIMLRDGRTFRRRVDSSKGMPENRMSRGEIIQKYRSLAVTAVGSETAEAILAEASGIFELSSLTQLARLLGSAEVSAAR